MELNSKLIREACGDSMAIPPTVALRKRGISMIGDLNDAKSIRKLDLAGNNLSSTKGLEALTACTVLDVSTNCLSYKGIKTLRSISLSVFNAGSNKISKFPSKLVRQWPDLKALILNNNSIRSTKKMIRSPQLTTLVLSHNLLDKFQCRLPQLRKLSIGYNALTTVPDLSSCPMLAELRIPHNKITVLPQSLAKNYQLRLLDAGCNSIETVEDLAVLADLPQLCNVRMQGNPVEKDPEYVAAIVGAVRRLSVLDQKRRWDVGRRGGVPSKRPAEAEAEGESVAKKRRIEEPVSAPDVVVEEAGVTAPTAAVDEKKEKKEKKKREKKVSKKESGVVSQSVRPKKKKRKEEEAPDVVSFLTGGGGEPQVAGWEE